MPLYEYECDACGHLFEAIVSKFSDPPPAACPKCGGLVRKLQSAPAFHLKGTGWYATDYAKKDASTAKTDDSTATKSESEKKESAGEKAEKKAEQKEGGGEKAAAAPKAEKPAETSSKSPTSSDAPKPKAD